MPKLTVNLRDVVAGFPEATVRIFPVWSTDAHRLGQGYADADGETWLPDPQIRVPDGTGTVVFDIPSSDDIGGAFYTMAVDGGPTWVGIKMPATDATFTRALISGEPLPPFAGFRPSDIAADNLPVVGWAIVVAEGDQWSFELIQGGGGGLSEVRPTDLDATNSPAVGDNVIVGPGNEFTYSPVPVSGYVYHQSHALGFTPVTSQQPSAKEWRVTVMDATVDGGIVAGLDFVTDYQGALILDVNATTNYEITNHIEHHFADGTTIVADRTISYRIQQGGDFTVPLVAFSARSVINLGSYTDGEGNTITVTEELLAQPVRIVHEISVARANGAAFQIDSASMTNGRATWTQLSAVVPNPGQGPPGKDGAAGPYDVEVYIDSATVPDTPTGGTVNVSAQTVVTAPHGWTITAPATIDHNLYVSRARIRPATQTGEVTPTWGAPFELGAHGTTGEPGPPGHDGSDATVNKANVYPVAVQIVRGSRSVVVTADPTAETLTLTAPHEQTDIYPAVAQIMQGSTQIVITPDNDDETLTITIPNESLGRALLAPSQQLPLELGSKGQKLVTGETVGVKHTQWVNDDSAVTQEEVYRENKKIVKADADGTVTITPDDDDSTLTLKSAPTKAQVYGLLKNILLNANNDVTFTDDDTAETITLGIIREIVETDWANLPVGFGFRIGTMVPRSGLWYIAKVANQKGAVGPDNDPTHFELVTNWAGTYNAAAWYLNGARTLYKGRVATALEAVTPNDPAPDDATNTKWHLDGEEVTKAAVYTQAKTILHAGEGISIDDSDTDETLTLGVDLSADDVYPGTKAMLKAGSGIAVEPDDGSDTITVSADVDKGHIYPIAKEIVKAGANIVVTASDTDETLAVSARLPDEADPRFYAVDSRDVRTVLPPYSYYTISEGFQLKANTETTLKGPVSRHDYDSDKPGYNIDTNNGRRNSNGKQFTNDTAGTTDRVIAEAVAITMANERQYGSDETLTFRLYTYGYAKPQSGLADNHLTETKTFNFTGGYQDDFHFDWETTFRLNPRTGEHDGYRITLEWGRGSTEVVAITVDAVRETHTLPSLGSIPTQKWTHHNARLLISQSTIDDWIPPELKPQINAAATILTWAVGTPNNTGRNDPTESDKADVNDPVFLFANNVLDKPFLRAAQDLSRVKLHFAGSADAGGGDVYLCTRIQGYPARILANTSVEHAWTLDYTAQGVLTQQDFYLIDPSGSGVGAPSASWDANPSGDKIHNVIDGMVHTLTLAEGLGNLTPGQMNAITTTDFDVVEAAIAGLLKAVRVNSNGLISAAQLAGAPRPLGTTGTSPPLAAFGPLRSRATRTGRWSNVTFVRPSLDAAQTEVRIDFRGTDDSADQVYVTEIAIEYFKYDAVEPASYSALYA